ncbi:MAG: shikimate kinase [Clostridium sp.]|nr:shikimate kinase [Bacteroides sp.]MCM1199537.1 shikimate kinase [Clostridium sp.]
MIIALTGFMGCGKSSVGKELSALLSYSLIDLDKHIEKKEGRQIPEIFGSDGEQAFRRMEQESLGEIASESGNIILSLGGGTVTTPECAEIIRSQTFCIYLRAKTETLVHNLTSGGYSGRPILKSGISNAETQQSEEQQLKERIESLMSQRAAIYESTAHHVIDIDGKSPEEIAKEAASLILRKKSF